MSESLAVLIEEGFRAAVARTGEGPDPADLRVRARARPLSPAERDEVFLEAVLAYRTGPKQVWAAVILEILAPAILARLTYLQPPEAAVDSEDLRQQLILQVLRAAARVPLERGPSYLRRRVLLRADKAMERWLVRHANHGDRRAELDENLTSADVVLQEEVGR